MSMNLTRIAVVIACLFAAAPLAARADETPSKDAAPADAGKMGHSPASKEHRMMDRNAPTGPADEAPAAPDNGMGHSPASKEHRMMKPKSHHKQAAPDKSTSSKPNMMGHSPASKEHTMMKDKPEAKESEKKDEGAKPTP